MSSLRAQDLSKSYKSRAVVDQCSLTVRQGETVGLLGPNGAGKTTCFYMMVGLVRCDAGNIWLDDENISTMAMHKRAHLGIGYLPQEASIFRQLSVRDNIMAILQLRKGLSRADRNAELESLLDELQVGHLATQKGITLSGGERRRVEIARALAAAPRYILLDEPFAGVDPISVNEIQRIVSHLKARGIGVLVTDHNVRETLKICDHAYILSDGKVLAEGTAEQVLANQKVREVYLGEDFTL